MGEWLMYATGAAAAGIALGLLWDWLDSRRAKRGKP